jgi:hypothetical protein
LGGLSKKAYQLGKIRKSNELEYLTVDGGNLLFKQEHLSPGLRQQAKITAAGIIDAYNVMGYDAMAVGGNDLSAGLSFLRDQAGRAKFTWLSANLVDTSTGKPIFAASLIRKVGSLSVGILGLTANDNINRFKAAADADLLPWQKVLPDLVADLAARCDLIILLSNYGEKQNREIAESFPGIHIIIQSAMRSHNMAPQLINNSLIAQTGKQGKYLGWMIINWQKSKTWGRAGTAEELATKKQELDGVTGRIGRVERREGKENLSHDARYQDLVASREQLLSEIIFLENELHDLRESGQAPSTFENHFIALDAHLPDQPEVKKIVDEIKSAVNQSGRNRADKSASSPTPHELRPDKLPFTGWMTCAQCHTAQADFWKKTDHAGAYRTLSEQEQQFNLDCLPCHVTAEYKNIRVGSDDAVLLSLPSQLQQVGCEVCHGPGRKHAASRSPADISRKPAQEICIRCHTAERDESFNYDNDVEKIACPASRP